MCVYVCMYVCMHVCMYACMYVCMHACMYVCTYVKKKHPCLMNDVLGFEYDLASIICFRHQALPA